MKTVVRSILIIGITALLFRSAVFSQIPVEVFVGHERSTIDIMFFRFFKNSSGEQSRFLFFNRNRAAIDYEMTSTSYLPQFGFTEAISYNHPKLRGFAPVAVVQVFNSGVYPKAGIQYYRMKGNFTIFTWLISETLSQPAIDYYLLSRYEPKLTSKLGLFTQVELLNAFQTDPGRSKNFVQRFRVGLKTNAWQYGVGADLAQSEGNDYKLQSNAGIFLRYVFN
jgi:hypothetical protein